MTCQADESDQVQVYPFDGSRGIVAVSNRLPDKVCPEPVPNPGGSEGVMGWLVAEAVSEWAAVTPWLPCPCVGGVYRCSQGFPEGLRVG